MKTPTLLLLALASSALAPSALAQSNVDILHKYTWSENCGWINWRDANNTAQGVRFNATFLQGFAWGENIGWINFGDGTPGGGGGTAYTNASGADHGVNILAGGNLGGRAWAENVGWISFATAAFLPAGQQARFDSAARRLRGYAWGENIGWVNLDNAIHYVATACYANCDGSTATPALTANDFQCFINKYAANDPYANCDGSTATPALTANDFQCFINKYAAGCN